MCAVGAIAQFQIFISISTIVILHFFFFFSIFLRSSWNSKRYNRYASPKMCIVSIVPHVVKYFATNLHPLRPLLQCFVLMHVSACDRIALRCASYATECRYKRSASVCARRRQRSDRRLTTARRKGSANSFVSVFAKFKQKQKWKLMHALDAKAPTEWIYCTHCWLAKCLARIC